MLRLRSLEPSDLGLADDELAVRAAVDATAFGELYLRHREIVFRYLRVRTRSDDDALELTAVTFERALMAIGRYSGRGNGPRPWLLRIARNAAIDAGRRRRTDVGLSQLANGAAAADPSPEDAALAADDRRRLRGSLMRPPEAQRDAIGLRFGADLTARELTAREIGAVLGKSEEATQKLIGRALARLKEIYRDNE